MKYGLTSQELDSILNVFEKTPNVEKAVLFGSRAKGNFRLGSDVDIAVLGKDLNFEEFLTLIINLEELDLLQVIDLIKYESIEDNKVIEHIKRFGKVLYERERTKTDPTAQCSSNKDTNNENK